MGRHALVPLLRALRVRVGALAQRDRRLYVGCADGTVRVYEMPEDTDPVKRDSSAASADEAEGKAGDTAGTEETETEETDKDTEATTTEAETEAHEPEPTLLASHALAKGAITALAVLPAARRLAVLSDSVVTLWALDTLGAKGASTVLSQARTAHAIASTTYFAPAPTDPDTDPASEVPDTPGGSSTPTAHGKVQRDLLVIGCRKKVVVYGAGTQLGAAWELALAHSPRAILFPAPVYADRPHAVHLLYSPQASAILSIRDGPANVPSSGAGATTPGGSAVLARLSVVDAPSMGYPPTRAPAAQAEPAAAFSVAGGWGGFGGMLSRAPVPVGTRTVGGEVLLVRDDLGVFLSAEGNFTRSESLHWPTAPDAMTFANPYIYAALPGTSPSIQVFLAPTLALSTTLSFPSPTAGGLSITALLSGGKGAATRVLVASTPTDRALAAEGSTLWAVRAADVGSTVDALVRAGRVLDAIGLVEAVGESHANLAPTQQLAHLRVLHAIAQFARGEYKPALEALLRHNVHPARVVALYPPEVAGELAVPREQWMQLFGAVAGARFEPLQDDKDKDKVKASASGLPLPLRNAHLSLGRKRSNDTLRSVSSVTSASVAVADRPMSPDGGAAAPSSPARPSAGTIAGLPRAAIDELIYYLSDRRQKLTGITPTAALPREADLPPLSDVPMDEIHALPDGPLSDLLGEQLLRTAQVVYTSLLRVYLLARPSLVGSLCRIENWCDVAQAEPLLRAKGRIDDLRDLYMQKQMHDKALSMLYEQAQDEDDPLDRYAPTVRYLQKLGLAHLELIFASVQWILSEDPTRALQVFTADEPEVDLLPREGVAAFLEEHHWPSAMSYLEHVVTELGDTSSDMHDKLATLYLRCVREPPTASAAGRRRKEVAQGEGKDEHDEHKEREERAVAQLLEFLNTSTQYRAHRLLSVLGKDELPQVRAVLLGRMGKHDEALRLYVYTLHDYIAAEAYCAREYARNPDPNGIFLHLLRLYLLPDSSSGASSGTSEALVAPALALVARQAPHLDAGAVLALLPPLVPLKGGVHDFLASTLSTARARRNEHRVVRGLLAARRAQVERLAAAMEVRRVRVSDQRICPQCHKRLGQSAIAVHAPRGEVTHLHCKDLFSAKLEKARA